VLILKEDKVVSFHTILQMLILQELRESWPTVPYDRGSERLRILRIRPCRILAWVRLLFSNLESSRIMAVLPHGQEESKEKSLQKED
jgi:hypothetical protein